MYSALFIYSPARFNKTCVDLVFLGNFELFLYCYLILHQSIWSNPKARYLTDHVQISLIVSNIDMLLQRSTFFIYSIIYLLNSDLIIFFSTIFQLPYINFYSTSCFCDRCFSRKSPFLDVSFILYIRITESIE